jgi:3'-phosphoadenosine 5'-phosphosulfate (PAPS) 3'-phosphatase
MPVTVWGGEHSQDARIAARLVSDAVKLCLEYQNHLTNKVNTDGNYTTNNTTLDKTDGTPVTVLDFAIQGYIISSLKKHEEARHQNNMSNNSSTVSFLAEEDVDDLRNDKNHKYLSQSALNLARSLDPNLTMEDFLDALDDDPSRGGKSPTHTHHHHQPHRSWILDPIDGTRGLLQGKQYAIGLAMCLDGRVVVGVLGNPSVRPGKFAGCFVFVFAVTIEMSQRSQ